MAYALDLAFDIPPAWGYLVCAVVVLPLVTHGVTAIGRLQVWTQPLWIAMLVLPYVYVFRAHPHALAGLWAYAGEDGRGGVFDVLQVRQRDDGGHRADDADGRAGRLPALHARAHRRQPAPLVAGRGHRRPGLGAAGRAEDAGRRAAGVDRDRPVGAAGSRRRSEPDVPGGLRHRLQPARHGGGGDGARSSCCRSSRSTSPTPTPARWPGRTSSRGSRTATRAAWCGWCSTRPSR